MTPGADIRAFMDRLGHDFARPELLVRALTHGSIASATRPDNQRLEFLGDRVLGLVIAHILYERHDDLPEGELARMLNAMVRRAMCTRVAERLDIGPALKLAGKGQKRTVITDNILGDALEALIGAIYLDGGLEAASRFIRQHWKDALEQAPDVRKDPKTALQEWAAARSLDVPAYEITSQSGPDHAPEFTVRLSVQDRQPTDGVAGSRRMAEQNAAEAFLLREKIWK